jgi:SNF2 family DNA or RNA helicase
VASSGLNEWLKRQRLVDSLKRYEQGEPCQPYNVLRPLLRHQKAALDFLRCFNRCALLDPPGSGKTTTAIAWAMGKYLPVLVVCPAAVKFHWQREIQACEPTAKPFIIQGRPNKYQIDGIPDFLAAQKWCIVNYDVLKPWIPHLPKFQALICDESHAAKAGAKSQRGDAILQLAERIPNTLFLTGSPALNRPSELEAMLVALGYLSPRERFAWRVRFCDGKLICINEKGVKYHGKKPEMRWSFKGSANVAMLARELDMFSVRRPFSEIMSSLPPITHTLLELDIGDLSEHDAMKERMETLLRSADPKSRGEALGLLGKMISWTATQKVPIIKDLITERLDAGESPVVFSDFLDPLHALRAELPERSLLLEGAMTQVQRDDVVKRFQESPTPLAFLISRRAGGTGLDGLQHKARTALFASLPWNPSSHAQAWARVAREGQKQPVEVITTLARGTVEEAMLRIIYEKAKVVDILCSSPSLSAEAKSQWEATLNLIGGL